MVNQSLVINYCVLILQVLGNRTYVIRIFFTKWIRTLPFQEDNFLDPAQFRKPPKISQIPKEVPCQAYLL